MSFSSASHNITLIENFSSVNFKEQTAEEKYGIPENFLEIEVVNPKIQNEFTTSKYVDYEIMCRVSFLFYNHRPISHLLNLKSPL